MQTVGSEIHFNMAASLWPRTQTDFSAKSYSLSADATIDPLVQHLSQCEMMDPMDMKAFVRLYEQYCVQANAPIDWYGILLPSICFIVSRSKVTAPPEGFVLPLESLSPCPGDASVTKELLSKLVDTWHSTFLADVYPRQS